MISTPKNVMLKIKVLKTEKIRFKQQNFRWMFHLTCVEQFSFESRDGSLGLLFDPTSSWSFESSLTNAISVAQIIALFIYIYIYPHIQISYLFTVHRRFVGISLLGARVYLIFFNYLFCFIFFVCLFVYILYLVKELFVCLYFCIWL